MLKLIINTKTNIPTIPSGSCKRALGPVPWARPLDPWPARLQLPLGIVDIFVLLIIIII